MADSNNRDNLNVLCETADCLDKICLDSFNRNLLAITLAQLLAEDKSKCELATLHHFLIMVANAVRMYMVDC